MPAAKHFPALQAHLRGTQPAWDGPALRALVDEVTATVREHIGLEREVTNYWTAKYFEQEAARNPGRTWAALLLGWIRQVSLHSCSAWESGQPSLAAGCVTAQRPPLLHPLPHGAGTDTLAP